MIKYDKLIKLINDRGITTYKMKVENIISQATWQSVKNGRGGLDHRSINKLCAYLGVQPGDLMEYIPDPVEPDQNPGEDDNPQG
ncbi:MAG: helix-turn-helix transcriptional regulator [Ruminococcaceae bacterium]|nr:helix-turn-helix transcriptional regulator [Oscillospiraceae bacterium]